MEGNLEDGGLKMVNVVHLQKALGWKTRKIWRREMDTRTKMVCFFKLANGFGVFIFNCRSKDGKGFFNTKSEMAF